MPTTILFFVITLLVSQAQADALLYERPRPVPTPGIVHRTSRLDVSKKRIVALRARCEAHVEVETGINARRYLAYQLAKIDTVESGNGIKLNRSDGRSIVADRDFGVFGFFDPTPRVTFYVSIGRRIAIVGMIYRGNGNAETCAERWDIPIEDA